MLNPRAVQLDKEIIELQKRLDKERNPLKRTILLGNILQKETEQYELLKQVSRRGGEV